MIKRPITGPFQPANQRPTKCQAGIRKSTRMEGRATYTSQRPIAAMDYPHQNECLFTDYHQTEPNRGEPQRLVKDDHARFGLSKNDQTAKLAEPTRAQKSVIYDNL